MDSSSAIGPVLRAARLDLSLTLDALARRCGVSRAMISKIERGESQPTAALLGRLCAGLGLDLHQVFQPAAPHPAPVSRAAEQATWRDPATGYVRRNLTPPGAPSRMRLTHVELPAGARVAFDLPWSERRLDQQVALIEGALDMTVGAATHRLSAGDCLHMTLDEPAAFHNPGETPARYIVAVAMLEGR
jgi:transcriptional regulator with XRE-family HTH domain